MVKGKKRGIVVLALIFTAAIQAKEWKEAMHNAVNSFLSNYKRPVTVLELCHKKAWSLSLTNYPGVFVIAPEKRAHKVAKKVEEKNIGNVVVLNPIRLSEHELEHLARCEYFDVVLVHDLSPKLIKSSIKALAELGDYIILTIKSDDLQPYHSLFESVRCLVQTDKESLFLLKTYKRGLDVARWNLCRDFNHQPLAAPRYLVESSFTHKEMHKNGKVTSWLPGINLMTFIMMRGICPRDAYLKSELLKLQNQNIDHNDLVLGNFVVMGAHKLVPIDFKDPRRKIDPKKCLAAAIAYFSNEKARFKDPRASLIFYHQCLKGK